MKILIAVDASPETADVVAYIKSQPWPADTKIRLLSVLIEAFSTPVSDKKNRYEVRAQEKAMTSLHQTIEGASSDLRAAGYSVEVALIRGIPHLTILDEASDWEADLIVMGERSERPSSEPVLGSVSRFVVEHATCSVELVRRPRRAPKDGDAPPTVLIASDGSECSMEALCWVASKPWPPGTIAHVVSVVERGRNEDDDVADDAVRQGLELLNAAGIQTSSEVLYGYPRIQIINEAGRRRAGLIIIGSHGRHGQDRLSLGSVSEAVAKNAHCSVVVVRSSRQTQNPMAPGKYVSSLGAPGETAA